MFQNRSKLTRGTHTFWIGVFERQLSILEWTSLTEGKKFFPGKGEGDLGSTISLPLWGQLKGENYVNESIKQVEVER